VGVRRRHPITLRVFSIRRQVLENALEGVIICLFGAFSTMEKRRAARDLFDAHRIIAMPDLDWTKKSDSGCCAGAGRD
jgi:hypothetical protein